jgi:uncharacterized protein YicC (UPF0701 family)
MKTPHRLLSRALLLPLLLLVPAACGDDAEARKLKKEAGEALDAAKSYTTKEIADMTTKLKGRWTDLKTEIDKLEAEAETRGAEARAKLDQRLAELQEKARDAKTRLDAIGGAGKDQAIASLTYLEKSFESAKAAVQDAWTELKKQ